MSTKPTSEQLQAKQLSQLHTQLLADIEALQEKEASLKAYETRLRSLVDRTGPVASAFQGAVAGESTPGDLAAAWDKFHRTQALFGAERRAFTDERMLFREQATALKQREEAVARREAWVERCEKEIAALAAATTPGPSLVSRRSLTTAPFLTVKQLFGRGN